MAEELNDHEKLWDMVKDIKFAMFTTHHDNGHLHSRPMTTQNGKGDESDKVWFFMSRSGDAAHDLNGSPQVNLAYVDPGKDVYVSVSGTAAVVDDDAKKKDLWNKVTEAWFPGGPDDPDLALVCVTITHADYWDVKSSKLVQLLAMAKAVVTGGGPPKELGDHGRVKMH
jgi:general stress protein 26